MQDKIILAGPRKNIRITCTNFLPHESIDYKSPHIRGCAQALGFLLKDLTRRTLKEKMTEYARVYPLTLADSLLARARMLEKEGLFVINGKNYLSVYFSMLEGFSKGTGLSLKEVIYLQSFADSGCQTIVVRDETSNAVNFLHIEENQQDEKIVRLQQKLEEARKITGESAVFNDERLSRTLYDYRLCRLKTPHSDNLFFLYPGLIGPGPAFGMNLKTNTLCMADTLNPQESHGPWDIWANALAYIVSEVGDVAEAKKLVRRLRTRGITVLGGYAIHMIQYGSPHRTFSFEFSANKMEATAPVRSLNKCFVAQTNYPVSSEVRKVDYFSNTKGGLEDRQVFHMLLRRTSQLRRIARSTIRPTGSPATDVRNLLELIASPTGDIETFEYGPVLSGFANPHSVSYTVGSLTADEARITIGKLTPTPLPKSPYQLFYSPSEMRHPSKSAIDLKSRVIHNMLRGKIPFDVAVVYSTPTKQLLGTRFAASDEDTAYVAGKVAQALETRGASATLVPVTETNLSSIADIKTDCIFNLIEWTGKDIDLSKRAFAEFRKLDIPVTGATEQNFMETSDKVSMKRLLEKQNLPTAPWQELVTGKEKVRTDFIYPVIVKPSQEHGSIGLSGMCLAANGSELVKIASTQIRVHRQPALAEQFIHGRELLVYLVEQSGSLKILPIEEILFGTENPLAFQTYESKWDKTHNDYTSTRVVLADLTATETRTIERVARKTFRTLGFRGYARLDIRFDADTPYILEANANPNVYDSDEDQIPGITFPEYVWAIVTSALREYKKGWKI